MKKTVVLGFIGTQLDSGKGAGRWEKWRPTVAITQHENLVIDRLELLHLGRSDELVKQLEADIASVSPETEVRAQRLDIKDPWDFEEVYAALFDYAQNYAFNPDQENYWLHITTGTHVAQICLFLLAEARYFPGVLLQSSPPRRQRQGDPGSYTLIDLDLSKYDQLASRFAKERESAISVLKSGIATRNKRFNHLIEEIERVAIRSKAPMLLMGPTGAGKSFLAKRIYELKKLRRQVEGSFVEINCATLQGDSAASTLFGHVKGAFTGAGSDRAGLLRSANKGVLFLDEIGELGLDEQAKLLKAIEDKKFYPVGSDKEQESNFQLIAGTNRDLRQEVNAGRFREDLFARINLWTYSLPSLAERPEDIEPNIDYFLKQYAAENGTSVRFNKEAITEFLRFSTSTDAKWQGNFRDLSASITRMATLADNGRINLADVSNEIQRLRNLWTAAATNTTEKTLGKIFSEEQLNKIDLFDQCQLSAVIAICLQSKSLSAAGRTLFAASREIKSSSNDSDRLKKYLTRFGLTWDLIQNSDEARNTLDH